jgi:predicted DNA-binding transcriptional regulator AlpA
MLRRSPIAYRLCVSESTVDNLVRRGKLPRPVNFHGMSRWKWLEIERLVDQPVDPVDDEILNAIKHR